MLHDYVLFAPYDSSMKIWCQVRRNLEQAKALMDALIKREETKREVMECQVNLQRIQMKYKV